MIQNIIGLLNIFGTILASAMGAILVLVVIILFNEQSDDAKKGVTIVVLLFLLGIALAFVK